MALSAHFVADMFVPFHVNGVPVFDANPEPGPGTCSTQYLIKMITDIDESLTTFTLKKTRETVQSTYPPPLPETTSSRKTTMSRKPSNSGNHPIAETGKPQ